MKLSTACLRIFFATIAWWGCFIAVAIAQAPFITTWETTANNESITIPTYPFAVYDYSVDWGDGQTDASITGDATHTYATAGVYTVSITSSFPHIYFNGGGDKDKLLTIEQWGDIAWTSMQYAFSGCSNLQVNATDAPNLSNCPNLTHMFNGASSLNADFNHWDISGVSSLSGMFINCTSFNGSITDWNVSNVENMAALFYNATAFNQPIGNWDVSKATTMVQMFFGASSFAQDIGNWDVSNVTAMASMFSGASSFDQPIGQWNITNVSNMSLMLNGAGLSTSNYDATLMGWAAQAVQPNVTLDANGLQYCAGETARDELINTHGWTFTGDSESVDCGAFITVWQTTASNETVTIPTHPSETYLYNVDWGDGSSDTNVSGDATHTYTTAGTYTVKITGGFPYIYFGTSADRNKILAITQWGDMSWTSMVNAFNGCSNLTIDALDAPDLSGVTSMLGMFFNANSITKGVAHWDVSQVDNMYALFSGATAFNDDLSGWNVSNVTNMAWMFRDATAFDQNIGEWNISNVTQMNLMLDNAGLSVNNYDATLDGWAKQAVVNGVTLGAANLEYCAAAFARQQLVNTYGWNIVGDMQTWACYSPDIFITTWQTTASNETITIPTFDGETYNYTVDWGDGNTDVNITGDATHAYTTAGTYTVTISGTFPRIHFNNQGDREKILSVEQWGSTGWTSMHNAFFGCSNLQVNASDAPNLSGVTSMVSMFENCTTLDTDFNHWDVSAVEEMSRLFAGATQFNGDIGNWDMANVTSIGVMFQGASNFNQDISNWDVSNVTVLNHIFGGATAFNQPIGNWNVGNVQHMDYAFAGATAFNQPIGNWNVSKVQYMEGTFSGATAFNQPIDVWDVSNATDMSYLFHGATAFNQNISGWNTGNVENMEWMFNAAINFQQDLSGWDVSGVTNMQRMFHDAAKFTSDLGGWDISQVANMDDMLDGSFITPSHYDATLIGWAAQNAQPNVALGAQGRQYCASKEARDLLINTHGWTISGDSETPDCGAFVSLWNTSNPGTSNNDQLTIPTLGTGYNYNIYWENFNDPTNNGTLTGQTGSATITFPAQGLYWVKITGDFPRIHFNNTGDRLKLIEINAWGDIQWQSMQAAFRGCENLQLHALDAPDLSQVNDMSLMFAGCTNVNADLSGWDVSHVQDFFATFFGATLFNGDVTTWQLDNATNTASMFKLASQFNQDVSGWNTGNMTDMSEMFYDATAFDQQLGNWNIESVTTMDEMLRNTALSPANYDATLTGWAGQNVQSGVPLGALGLEYCAVEPRNNLINNSGWNITGDSQAANCLLPITGISFDNMTFTYDGTEHTLAITGPLPQGASVTYTNNGRTDAGSQTVTAFIDGGPTYDDLTLTATLTVSKATITGITFDDESFTYDGTAHEITIGGTLPQGTSVNYTDNTRTDAGSQTATAEINGGTNYNDLTLTATLTVSKATITGIAFDDGSFTYDGTAHEITIGGTLPQGTSVNYTDNTRTDAGSQTATAEINGGTNYNDLTLTATLTVSKATITGIAFDDGSFTYDGTAHEITIGGTLPQGTSVNYTDNTRTDAGSQTASAEINGGTNYNDLTLTATLTVTKATITGITFDDGSFTYDGTAHEITIGGSLPQDASVAYTDNTRTDAGSQTASAEINGGTNYNDLTLTAMLTVTPATHSINLPSLADMTYGDAPYPLPAVSSGGVEINWTSSDESVAVIDGVQLVIVGVGTVTISGTVLEDPNYSNTPEVTQILTVAKATQQITLEAPATVNRDAGTITLDASASSGLPVKLAVDDPEVATLTGTTLNIHRIGTVQITATQPGDENHEAAEAVMTTVLVIDPEAELPMRVSKVVSPNGDGINEYLIIEGIKDYHENKVAVFNRNGTILYEAKGYNNGSVAFGGISTGQLPLPAGTYFYVAEIKIDGTWEYEKGWFLLRY